MKFFIISGGHIDDAFAVEWIQTHSYDQIIAADSGMNFLHRNHIVPNVIAGDFDSVSSESLEYFQKLKEVEVLRLNPIKDDTDTEYVIREAIRRGAKEITILGATGTRLDHVLANMYLLGIGFENNVSISIVDTHNRIRMISQSLTIAKEKQFGDYVSVLPVAGTAYDVTLKGMKYPLQDAVLQQFSSVGVSNEIVGEVAEITVTEGTLLVIESRDKF